MPGCGRRGACSQLEMLRPYITDARFERDFGAAYGRVTALRMVARRTLRRLGEGDFVGPEVSVDKLLLSSSEQAVLNLARDVLRGRFELDDSPDMRRWRGRLFLYPVVLDLRRSGRDPARYRRAASAGASPCPRLTSPARSAPRSPRPRRSRSPSAMPGSTELGFDELLESEPQLAVVTLFEEKGRLRLTGPALDSVVLAALRRAVPLGHDASPVSRAGPARRVRWRERSLGAGFRRR